jgi:hypothetical protein
MFKKYLGKLLDKYGRIKQWTIGLKTIIGFFVVT